MPWLKLSDDHADDPRILAAGPAAAWLHTCALVYCARHLTDGHLPAGQVRRLADVDNAGELVEVLLRLRLWETAVGGYMIPDFLGRHGNSTRAEVEDFRSKKRDQMAASRSRSKKAPKVLPVTRQVTSRQRGEDVPPPAPTPAPAPYPVTSPLPLPPIALSSSTAPRHPEFTGADLLLLDQLTSLMQQDDDTGRRFGGPVGAAEVAQRSGADPARDEVWLAQLVMDLRRVGMEPAVARRMALAQPHAVDDWITHPERWERANNPAGLLRARIGDQPPPLSIVKEHSG